MDTDLEDGSTLLVESVALPLPDPFVKFLNENGLDPSIYSAADSIPRYLRLKPGCENQLQEIEMELSCMLEKVGWLPGFYSIPPNVQIAGLKAYREGKIYGIDAASGAAVLALGVSAGDHILDLCAAPGAKLCMLLDLIANSGSVTGVDVARHRLAACRTMIQKYSVGNHCRLFVADGTTFSLLPIRKHMDVNFRKISADSLDECPSGNTDDIFMEWKKSRKLWHRRKKISKSGSSLTLDSAKCAELIFYGRHSGVVGLRRTDLSQAEHVGNASEFGYDKVLVDAECTHDGSFRHVKKFENWGWASIQRRVLDAQRTDTLSELQVQQLPKILERQTKAYQLLKNGFRLLRVGGSLVYSTCSLTVAQNEDIVDRFLSEISSAELQEIEVAKDWPCRSGRIPKTLRFDPLTSQTSGLFVAKFLKVTSCVK